MLLVANTTNFLMHKGQFNPLDSLIFLTNRVGRLLSKSIRKQLNKSDAELLPTHMGVLVDLWLKDGVRQQDLAVATIKDKGTIARALVQMEQQNLLVRIPDDHDKRNKRIYLTHKGKALKEELIPHAHAATQDACQGINEKDLAICKKVLEQMYHNLNRKLQNQLINP